MNGSRRQRSIAAYVAAFSEITERLKALERENRELRQANEILRKASAYFAQAELWRGVQNVANVCLVNSPAWQRRHRPGDERLPPTSAIWHIRLVRDAPRSEGVRPIEAFKAEFPSSAIRPLRPFVPEANAMRAEQGFAV